jgi:hypothetical protein
LNASHVGFQVYLDNVAGTPIAAGIIPRVDVDRANSAHVVWNVQTTPGTHKLIIVIMSCDQPYITKQYETTITVQQPIGSQFPYIFPLFICGIIPISVGALAIFLGATEAGIYMLFLFFLPLYSKMRPEEVLDSFIRGKILGYVRANPGCHYNLIKQDLKLHNGTLIHHLDTLERNGASSPENGRSPWGGST